MLVALTATLIQSLDAETEVLRYLPRLRKIQLGRPDVGIRDGIEYEWRDYDIERIVCERSASASMLSILISSPKSRARPTARWRW